MAAFNSNRGSISDRMKTLQIKDMLLAKQEMADPMADPMADAAASVSDPASPPETGLVNPMAGAAMTPTHAKAFLDVFGTDIAAISTHLGSWPQTAAQLKAKGMPIEILATINMGVESFRAAVSLMINQLDVFMQDPDVQTAMHYDGPVTAPNLTASAEQGVMPPIAVGGGF